MAGRPTKQGIDYFPVDVGFFEDIKIRKISRSCGPNSTSILICLLCNIYKDNGYYILWDEDLPFVIADTVGVSEGAVKEVILKSVQVEFFSKEMFDKYKILTSIGIQKRFFLATYQRKETGIIDEFVINCTNNSINHANNPINGNDNEQRKVKVKGKRKKEINSPTTNTCEAPIGEIMQIDLMQCFEALRNDTIWLEPFCMNHGITPLQFAYTLQQFFMELQNRGETTKNLKDAKHHFSSWYNLNKNKLNENNRKPSKENKLRNLASEFDAVNRGEKPFTSGATLPDL